MSFAFGVTIALAVAIGVSLGLLGAGGSILAVPLLVYVAGLPATEAIAISLLVVGVTSAVGLIPHAMATLVLGQQLHALLRTTMVVAIVTAIILIIGRRRRHGVGVDRPLRLGRDAIPAGVPSSPAGTRGANR